MGLMEPVMIPSWKEGAREAIEPMPSVAETATQLWRQSSALGRQKGQTDSGKGRANVWRGSKLREKRGEKRKRAIWFPKAPV
jgi:hypothetical protein